MRLRITLDVFSGRPNPRWTVEDPQQVESFILRLVQNPDGVAESEQAVPSKLGLRAVHVDIVSDDAPGDLPRSFILAASGPRDPAGSARIAEAIMQSAPAATEQLPQEFWDGILAEIRQWPSAGDGAERRLSGGGAAAQQPVGVPQIVCPFDTDAYNPGFWNIPAVQPYNNCYNYATNVVTNTFAQPGRAHGYAIPPTCTCAEVAHGAQLDGYRPDGNCQPPGTYDRWLVALVTGTFPGGVRDFHWYRLQTEGFWGHKPGQGAVINTDNAGNVIYDPQTCDRGYYTDWCGYFLCSNLVVIQ